MTYNVITLPLHKWGAEATTVAQTETYADALIGVAEEAEKQGGELRPVIAGAVAALHFYSPMQAWEVRVNGERVSLLAVQIADEEEEDVA